MEQAFDGFRTQKMAPTMVKPRKQDTSEEMSFLVEYRDKTSNLIKDLNRLYLFAIEVL